MAAEAQWRETLLNVIKTPDFFELPFLSATKEISDCMNLCTTGPTALFLIVAPSDFTEERRQELKSVVKFLGQDAIEHSMVVLTQSENLLHENLSVQDIITVCNQRQYRIPLDKNADGNNLSNNKLQELMEKIQNMMNDETQDSRKAVTLFKHINSFSKDLRGYDKNTSVNIWPNNEKRNVTFKNQDDSSMEHGDTKISNLDGDIMKIITRFWKEYQSMRLKMLEREKQSETKQDNTVHKQLVERYKDKEDHRIKDDEQRARKMAEVKKRCADLEKKCAEDRIKREEQHEKKLEEYRKKIEEYKKIVENNEKMLEEYKKKLEEYEKKTTGPKIESLQGKTDPAL